MYLFLSGADNNTVMDAFEFAKPKRIQFAYKYLKDYTEARLLKNFSSARAFGAEVAVENIENHAGFEAFCEKYANYIDFSFGYRYPLISFEATVPICDYLAIFGAKTHGDYINFFKKNKDILAQNRTKVHGINVPNVNEVIKLPFYSLSSCAFASAPRFGTTFEYVPNTRRIHAYDNTNKRETRERMISSLLNTGLDVEAFLTDDNSTVTKHSVLQWSNFAKDLEAYNPDTYWIPKKQTALTVRHKPTTPPDVGSPVALAMARQCNTCFLRPNCEGEPSSCPEYQKDSTCNLIETIPSKSFDDVINKLRVAIDITFNSLVFNDATNKVQGAPPSPSALKESIALFDMAGKLRDLASPRKPSLSEQVAAGVAAGNAASGGILGKMLSNSLPSSASLQTYRSAKVIEARAVQGGEDDEG